jgi:predicted molibdopterin-dependent oxidoreductase YjgC
MGNTLTTCVYCGCGCGLYLQERAGRITGAIPSQHHPVSRGNLCVKGWHIHEFIHSNKRLTQPLIRKDGVLTPASWDEALDHTAKELGRVRDEAGGNAIGVLSSAKCTNEENYLLQKFTRAVLQTNNIDHCARL